LSFGKNNDAMHQITVNDDKMTLMERQKRRKREKEQRKGIKAVEVFLYFKKTP